MCGIAGYWGHSPPAEAAIKQTLELMKNRGPDHQAYASFSLGPDVQVRLLHSRLSIIDLDPRSHQPFTIGDTTLVFNGEIYNYVELRQNLEQRGIPLHTNSDTEVLLHYYRLHGERCVDFFEGMWAFALYDRRHDLALPFGNSGRILLPASIRESRGPGWGADHRLGHWR